MPRAPSSLLPPPAPATARLLQPRWQLLHVLVACSLVAAMFTVLRGQDFWRTLAYSVSIGLCSWGAITAGRRLLPRDPDDGWPRGKAMLGLVAAGTLAGLLAGTAVANLLIGPGRAPSRQAPPLGVASEIAVDVLIGGVIAGYFYLRGRAQALQLRAAAAAHESTLARLSMLQSQLEPHMLFNTLANLRALIDADPPRAQAMLDRLIDFLRATLAGSRAATHPLRDEFARLDDYLALMQVRMGERLQAGTALPAALAGVEVPPLLLQPLVENAIKHGLEPQRGPGSLTVTATLDGAMLVLAVVDSGRGLDAAGAANARAAGDPAGGFGLAQVRERLQTLYGDRASLALEPAAPGPGTRAEIRLPLA